MEKRVALLEQRIGQITEGEGSRIQTLCEQAKRLQEGGGVTVNVRGIACAN
ncbi:unnamed protein product [Symbiodinium sp. CCMP2456]|nr:unnamed protein product [Symbiodinium sp. CCMP2456]